VTTTQARPPRIPAAANRIRLQLWQRGQARLRERHGFDLETKDALERARDLVAKSPQDAEAHLLLASVLATRGEPALAESEVRQAIELCPQLARAHTTLATLLVQRGERAEGLKAARNAAALDMEDPTILFNLGLAEWLAGERRTARAAFRRAAQVLAGDGQNQETETPRRWWHRMRHRD